MSDRIHLICAIILQCLPAFGSCQENPDPRLILKKAIAAHGGEKNITMPRRGTIKGVDKKSGHSDETTIVETFDLPRQWKKVYERKFKGKKTITTVLMAEGRFWQWDEGTDFREIRNDGTLSSYLEIPLTLLNLMNDNVKSSPLKETKVHGTAAVGFRAVWDSGMANYYFDKAKGLLIRIDRKIEAKQGELWDSRMVWRNYKEIDGVQLPYESSEFLKSGVHKDYTLASTYAVTEVKLLDKLPGDVFILPRQKRKDN